MDNMTLQTVDRAVSVLEMLAEHPMTLQQLETETGLNRTTIARLIQTLANRKMVEKNTSGLYQIGLKVIEMASVKLNQIELKTEAVPILRELSTSINQVCHMGILDQGEVVYIEKIEPMTSIRMFSEIGKRVPIHSTSLGKILISGLDDARILEILAEKGMKPYTRHTITDPKQYLDEIERVRKLGFAVDDAENEQGIYCVGAPIRDYRNMIIAAISSTGISREILENTDGGGVDKIRRAALEISKHMGYKA